MIWPDARIASKVPGPGARRDVAATAPTVPASTASSATPAPDGGPPSAIPCAPTASAAVSNAAAAPRHRAA